MFIGKGLKGICDEASHFLIGKSEDKEKKNNTFIRIYGYQVKPILLPNFFLDKHFVAEIFRRYIPWMNLLDKKKER